MDQWMKDLDPSFLGKQAALGVNLKSAVQILSSASDTSIELNPSFSCSLFLLLSSPFLIHKHVLSLCLSLYLSVSVSLCVFVCTCVQVEARKQPLCSWDKVFHWSVVSRFSQAGGSFRTQPLLNLPSSGPMSVHCTPDSSAWVQDWTQVLMLAWLNYLHLAHDTFF